MIGKTCNASTEAKYGLPLFIIELQKRAVTTTHPVTFYKELSNELILG